MDIKKLKYDSYVKMIKNSVGTKMFRNLYIEIDNKKIDATQNGNLSCAFFVSNILLIFGLISNGHATVVSTIKDIEEFGWQKISKDKIKPGDVIVWEKKKIGNSFNLHIGFYIGNKKVVSNNYWKKRPIINKLNEKKRKIDSVYTYEKIS